MPTQHDDDQEPAFKCAHCPRLLRADELHRYTCRVCEDRTAKHLRAFVGLYQQLGDVLVPSGAINNSGPVSGSTAAPLPVTQEALDLRGPGGIVSTLVGIELRWLAANNFTAPGFRGDYQQELPKSVQALLNLLPWACDEYPNVAADLQRIDTIHGRASSAITGERHVRVPVGCCPTVSSAGVPCGEQLRVSPWAMEIRCKGCDTRWPHDQWIPLGAKIQGFAMPIAEVA